MQEKEPIQFKANSRLHRVINKLVYGPRLGLMGGVRFSGTENLPDTEEEPYSLLLPRHSRLNIHAASAGLSDGTPDMYFWEMRPKYECSKNSTHALAKHLMENDVMVVPVGIAGTNNKPLGPINVHYEAARNMETYCSVRQARSDLETDIQLAQLTAMQSRQATMLENARN